MSCILRSATKSSRPFHLSSSPLVSLILASLLASAVVTRAQSSSIIRIDASQPFSEPGPAPYDGGTAKSPSNETLGINSRYLMRDGKPWLPVMGEFHFSRYPQSKWEEEILKMKSAGVDVIATYVIWIHHEEVKGQVDWSGQRDLRTFVQLCAKHGMYVEPRIGPWDHGEVRNGGLPDWVLKESPTRVNDPVYLASVRKWYGEIGHQLRGLLWKDGGPVIAVQLENEYSKRGPGAGEAHILELKKIAIANGIDVPLYFVTGWDNAAIPPRAVIPVYGGGYPDAPWDRTVVKLPPPEVYAFRFQGRVPANMGAMRDADSTGAKSNPPGQLPYFTAEIGGGIEDTYHRRPVIQPDDIGAMFPVMLGSGVNLYGTYMFQGGENPDGKLSTLQESQNTGYPNDVPVKSYDFQAPLGEFGQERASLRKLKIYNYFLNDFGADLAPMMVHAPAVVPADTQDRSVPRASVRSKGDTGFIFLNNYIRGYAMPERKATQFEIVLPSGTLQVPRHPVDIPAGVYFIWPFNLRIGGMTVRYSTAQLFTRLENGDTTTLYFSAIRGIPAEFSFDAKGIANLHASSGEKNNEPGSIVLSGVKPGVESSIDLLTSEGKKVRIVVLAEQEAENAWKVRIGPRNHLLISNADFFADPDGASTRIWLRSRQKAQFDFTVTPAPAVSLHANEPLQQSAANTQFASFTAKASPRDPKLSFHQIRVAGEAPVVKTAPPPDWSLLRVAQAPEGEDFKSAAKWSISVSPQALEGLSDLYLQIRYKGDVARLYSGDRLLTDDFFNGRPWQIGLRRFLEAGKSSPLELAILPLRKDAPVYFELPNQLVFEPGGQTSALDEVSLIPEYQIAIDTDNH